MKVSSRTISQIPRQQEPGQPGDGFATEREKGAGSSEQKEGRRAEVGNPAGQEQGHGRLSEIRLIPGGPKKSRT